MEITLFLIPQYFFVICLVLFQQTKHSIQSMDKIQCGSFRVGSY